MARVKSYRKKIACLESLWDSDVEQRLSVIPIVKLTSKLHNLKFTHLTCNTREELKHNLKKLKRKSGYGILYLSFHGHPGEIVVDGSKLKIESLASLMGTGFTNWVVHFGTCETIDIGKARIFNFIEATGVSMVLGYRKDVYWVDGDIVLVGLYSGMRAREIFNLMKDNVNFRNRIIHVTRTKNWEVRDLPMNELLTKVLKEAIDKSPKNNPYVFPNPKTGKPFTSIKTSFKKAVKKIGLPEFRFHDLRHSWCSRMCELGVDEATIRELGGWKTKNMIDRYAHPSIDHKREALERLEKVPPIFTPNLKHAHTSNLTKTLTSDNIKTI